MNIEALLEKKEKIQIEILRQLIFQQGELTFQTLSDKINLSRPSLETYLDDLSYLGKKLGQTLKINRKDNQLILEKPENLSLDKIISFLLTDSIKYRLLMLLFKQKPYMIIDLTEALLISESTLFRKIKELNQLLNEFDLQIKNNKLNGEESQIRYFYYLLFEAINPVFRPQELEITKTQQNFIHQLEESLRTKFSSSSKAKMHHFLAISEQRKQAKAVQMTKSLENKAIYQDDHLYQLVDSIFYQHIYANSNVNNSETIIFYSFLTSFFIMDEESHYRFEIFRSKKTPAVLLSIAVRERMLHHYFFHRLSIEEEKTMSYQLAQVNNKFYFFKGSLLTTQQEKIMAHEKELLDSSFEKLLENLKAIALNYFPNQNAVNELIFGYRNTLILLELSFVQNLTIAYDLSAEPAYQIPLEQQLKSRLSGIENIVLEPYHEGRSYDLLISSQREDIRKTAYLLSEFNTAYDMKRLIQKIEILKQEKIQRKTIQI